MQDPRWRGFFWIVLLLIIIFFIGLNLRAQRAQKPFLVRVILFVPRLITAKSRARLTGRENQELFSFQAPLLMIKDSHLPAKRQTIIALKQCIKTLSAAIARHETYDKFEKLKARCPNVAMP